MTRIFPLFVSTILVMFLSSGLVLAQARKPGMSRNTEKMKTVEGHIQVPLVTGRPGTQPFTPHPGWVDIYGPGDSTGVSCRIESDGKYILPRATDAMAFIANFDRMETPPIIQGLWPNAEGSYDVLIDGDYIFIPEGYPKVWDEKYVVRTHNHYQTFIARSREIYSCTAFDGPKIIWWGNKVNFTFLRDHILGECISYRGESEGALMCTQSSTHSDHEFPRAGWRPGEIVLEPGKKYAVQAGGYNSHGGQHFDLDLFVKPDDGTGYGPGEAYTHRTPTGGDLCLMVIGNINGQIVENQICSEEWEILLPRHEPSKNWGESFRSHGRSMAGVTFWGSSGGVMPVSCQVKIRENGPAGKIIGPVKTAMAHPSPLRPTIRYPDGPGQMPGYENFYEKPPEADAPEARNAHGSSKQDPKPYVMFQAAFLPDEVPLTPGKDYYVELLLSAPMLLFADGYYDPTGYGYYDGKKMETDAMFHSNRWTLAMSIVTYENPGGAPNEYALPKPSPGENGNLIANGGAEDGDFRGWTIGSDPAIDPSSDIPTPANHSGNHRFGISAGWVKVSMYQYQEVTGIEPGKTYEAGMWASHADGTHESAELLWCDGPFGGKENLLAGTAPEAEKEWKELKGRFVPKKKSVTLIIRYKHTEPSNVASIHVDDVYLKQVSKEK